MGDEGAARQRRRREIMRLASVLLLAAVTACGGSAASESGGAVRLSDLRQRGAPPAYWLGETFAGLPLSAISGSADRPNLVYGTCEPVGADGGCAPPLQLQHWPLTARSPALFMVTPDRRAACRLPETHGLTAAIFETTGGVEVYLGKRVVVLFGERSLVRRAMSELRPINPQEPPLPSPPAWVLGELRRCAPPSPDAKIRELQEAGAPTAYWVGVSFEGHPLATAEGDEEEVRLVYGECARDEFAFDNPCWAPLEIRVGPLQSPGNYHESLECRIGEARGAPTALLADAHTLDVFAGNRTVRLIGPDLEQLGRAADALRRLEQSRATERLPMPAPDVVQALRARCR
jgi:hypothetical protein